MNLFMVLEIENKYSINKYRQKWRLWNRIGLTIEANHCTQRHIVYIGIFPVYIPFEWQTQDENKKKTNIKPQQERKISWATVIFAWARQTSFSTKHTEFEHSQYWSLKIRKEKEREEREYSTISLSLSMFAMSICG